MSKYQNDTFLGMKFGVYILKEVIAIGGMARVYLAEDESLQRPAAVKVLDLNQDWVDETILERFKREAHAVAQLDHPNIITIYAYGTDQNAYYQAMQYVEGQDLRIALMALRDKGATMPIDDVLAIMTQVASALDYAHRHGIIHRDIKPSNILLRRDGVAILTDFGLVLRNDDQTMGTAFGTPRYIAPEQAVASQQAVAQSDIYALAVILYEMLTGDTPFDGDSPMEIALAHVSDQPEKPSTRNAKLPTAVDGVIMQALSKEPSDRPASATDFINDLAAAFGKSLASQTASTAPIQQTDPLPVPPPKKTGANRLPFVIGAVALLLLGLVGGGWALFGIPGTSAQPTPTAANVAVAPTSDALQVELRYTSELFVIHNTNPDTLRGVGRLAFVRGDRPYTVTGTTTLAPGECLYVLLPGSPTELLDPCDSSRAVGRESDPAQLHWRSDDGSDPSFAVMVDGAQVATCETVPRGRGSTCTFAYPPPAD